MNDDLALAIRVAKDTRSAVGNLDYRIFKLLDINNARPRRDDTRLVARMAACAALARRKAIGRQRGRPVFRH